MVCGCCAPWCFSTCLNKLCFFSPLARWLLLKKGIKRQAVSTGCCKMICWRSNRSSIGKRPIDSLKRTPCYTERFWVSLPPIHPDVVPHEEEDKIVYNRDKGEKQTDWENVCIGCRAPHLWLLHSFSHFTWRFWVGSSCESGMWITLGLANFTSPFPLLPHSLCVLQYISLSPCPVTPASISTCPHHSSSFMGFFLQAPYSAFPSECTSLPVPIDDSNYILPIFYLVVLSLSSLFAFHPFYFQTQPFRDSLMTKLFIKHKSSFWMHISNVSKAWKSLQCVLRH